MEEKIKKSKQLLKDFQEIINPVLNEILDEHILQLNDTNLNYEKFVTDFAKYMKDQINNPAKRARPAFVYYAYLLNTEEINEEKIKAVLRIAAAIEIIHTALLFHDDVMDQDVVRRGKNTFHQVLKLNHENNKFHGNSEHYGYSQAISAGDIALTLGYSTILESDFENNLNLKVLKNVFSSIIPTGYGQAFDIFLESSNSASENDILKLHEQKTALYTYMNPIMSGLLLSSANNQIIEAFQTYSKYGGVAFQLQDDVLGLFGNPDETGKSDFADLKEGKHTLLTDYTLKHASENDKERFLEIWRNSSISENDANVAREIVRNCGALEYSNNLAKNYANKSVEAINKIKPSIKNLEAFEFFEGISLYMAVERKK